MVKNDFSILVICLFDYPFHNNYEICHSAIRLCVVAKYASRLEHTKSLSIIGKKRRVIFLKNSIKLFMIGSNEKLNADYIVPRYSEVFLPGGGPIQ